MAGKAVVLNDLKVLLNIFALVLSVCPKCSEAVPQTSLTAVPTGQANMTFSCVGEAVWIRWTIDDVGTDLLDDITVTIEQVGTSLQSNLTISVSMKSVVVQCMLVVLDEPPLLLQPVTVFGSAASFTVTVSPCILAKESPFKHPGNSSLIVPVVFSVTGPITSSGLQACNEFSSCLEYIVTLNTSNVPIVKEEEENDTSNGSLPNESVSTQCEAVRSHPPLFPILIVEQITTLPESTSVMLGNKATFFCVGEGVTAITWIVNDTLAKFVDQVEEHHETLDGVVSSNLTIVGRADYNNISIQCMIIVSDDVPLRLSAVYLTVLGISPVQFLTFAPPACIRWTKPMFVSDDVKDLQYNVSVSGADLALVTFTTNETQYCPELTLCQEYTVTITPFSVSPGYSGDNFSITNTTLGDYYEFKEPYCLTQIRFSDAYTVVCSIICQIKIPPSVCPHQRVKVVTAAVFAEHDSPVSSMLSSDPLLVSQAGFITMNVSDLPAGGKFSSTLSILNLAGDVVDSMMPSIYSTFSVQDVDIFQHSNFMSVKVNCSFAANAPSTGCWVLFENDTLGSFDGTVSHSPADSLFSSGVVTISQSVFEQAVKLGLTNALFNVEVYNVNEEGEVTGSPALEQKQILEMGSTAVSVPIPAASSSTSPSNMSTQIPSAVVGAIAAAVVAVTLIVFAVIGIIIGLLCFQYQHKNQGVTANKEPGNNMHPL